MSIDPKLIFAVLGPLFLVLGAVRCAVARALVPQGKAWLMIGAIFSVVAAYLWLSPNVGRVATTARASEVRALNAVASDRAPVHGVEAPLRLAFARMCADDFRSLSQSEVRSITSTDSPS